MAAGIPLTRACRGAGPLCWRRGRAARGTRVGCPRNRPRSASQAGSQPPPRPDPRRPRAPPGCCTPKSARGEGSPQAKAPPRSSAGLQFKFRPSVRFARNRSPARESRGSKRPVVVARLLPDQIKLLPPKIPQLPLLFLQLDRSKTQRVRFLTAARLRSKGPMPTAWQHSKCEAREEAADRMPARYTRQAGRRAQPDKPPPTWTRRQPGSNGALAPSPQLQMRTRPFAGVPAGRRRHAAKTPLGQTPRQP